MSHGLGHVVDNDTPEDHEKTTRSLSNFQDRSSLLRDQSLRHICMLDRSLSSVDLHLHELVFAMCQFGERVRNVSVQTLNLDIFCCPLGQLEEAEKR